MEISLAKTTQIQSVISFFDHYLSRDNPAIYSDEFFCPLGIKAAILRKQIVVAIVDNQLIGAYRFYPKKTQGRISLYQFAISEKYRSQGLLKMMLQTVHESPITSLCPIDCNLNEYYRKSGWRLHEKTKGFYVWIF